MPQPTLPPELIAHILGSLDPITPYPYRDRPVPPYQDLYNCCLVARSFLAPAKAALYRTIKVTMEDEEQLDDETLEPTDEYYLTMWPSVILRGDRGGLVRKLDVEVSTKIEGLALPQELFTLFQACPLVADVAFRGIAEGQVKGLSQILQSCRDKLRRFTLEYCGDEDQVDALNNILLFLRSQTRLQHLRLSYWSDFPLTSPPPSFRLRSLRCDHNQPAELNYLLNFSSASLRSLHISMQRSPESGINLSAFINLTSLHRIRGVE